MYINIQIYNIFKYFLYIYIDIELNLKDSFFQKMYVRVCVYPMFFYMIYMCLLRYFKRSNRLNATFS